MRYIDLVETAIMERFINAVGNDEQAIATKEKYKDQVWDILQSSYAKIGGIKGAGFASPDDMVQSIPMWKVAIRDGQVRAVMMYKDKNGRKGVASGTDGTPEGIALYKEIAANDIKRAYGEKSKASLGTLMKLVPWEVLKDYIVSPDKVQSIVGAEVIPVSQIPQDKLPDDAKMTLSKYPMLAEFGYLADFNGTLLFKVLFGTPKKSITYLLTSNNLCCILYK